MSEVFISYARSTAREAAALADALRGAGYSVWRDDEIPAHRAYADVIAERLAAATAVLVIWSADAARSEWVRSEAERARTERKLVQVTVDGAPLPMPFDQIQCADLRGWQGDPQSADWRRVAESIAALTDRPAALPPPAPRPPGRISICVLPFANMSGDPEQDYFSDGISEDIITDLSKVSALSVVSRNSAFQFKGRHVDVRAAARQLGVSHVLEGSVRKAGDRVRITAQLIEAAADTHLWAERYDRQLTDIFALQDEISQAIVAALKLALAPDEKRAIAARGTANAEAYDLYLMARRNWLSGNTNVPGHELIIRLCRRVVELDPNYAQAWTLMALAQNYLHQRYGLGDDNGDAAAARALALDPGLAEPHALRARALAEQGRQDESAREIGLALALGPDSFDVNNYAGYLAFRAGRFAEAIAYYERASALSDEAFGPPGMLISLYRATGDAEAVRRSARVSLARTERAAAEDRTNSHALAWMATALAALGERERAREVIERALVVDPESRGLRYNLACTLCADLQDADGALALLGPYLEGASPPEVKHLRVDPDFASLRADPRFQAMVAQAERRVSPTDGPRQS